MKERYLKEPKQTGGVEKDEWRIMHMKRKKKLDKVGRKPQSIFGQSEGIKKDNGSKKW